MVSILALCECTPRPVMTPGPSPSQSVPIRRLLDPNTRWQTAIHTARREVIRDSARWHAVWMEMRRNFYPPGEARAVNFSQEIVVLAAMGSRPSSGYGITIQEVLLRRDTLLVLLQETCPPGGGIVSPTMSAPVDAIALNRRQATVVFVEAVTRC